MKSLLASFAVLFLFSLNTSAQLKGELLISNDSERINDGRAEAVLEGGKAPYTYKWSNQNTPLKSSKSSGLTEGVRFTVVVTDSESNKLELSGKVPAESSEEKINSIFLPIVNGMSSVLFWAPLETFGLIDPIVYYDHESIYAKGFRDDKVNSIFLMKVVPTQWG